MSVYSDDLKNDGRLFISQSGLCQWPLLGRDWGKFTKKVSETKIYFTENISEPENNFTENLDAHCSGAQSILRNVQQGDLLGPLLFALLLQPVAQQLQEVEGLHLNTWYLDDGTLVGNLQALQAARDILKV